MGKLVNAFLAALAKYGDGRYSYYNNATGKGIGCSNYLNLGLKEIGLLKSGETEPWAAQKILGVLAKTDRFQKLDWNPSILQPGDILWSHGHHVAIWVGDGYGSLYEAAPESTHSVAVCGTGVGLHRGHTYYNCGTGTKTWSWIFRIIEEVETEPTVVVEKVEEVSVASTATKTEINMIQLKKNSKNNMVSILQMLLNTNGAGLAIDGSFGNFTETAVKNYQSKKGLIVDGIVGNQTWASLISNLPTLKKYSKGLYVAVLQVMLNEKLGSKLVKDGSFGPATLSAVKVFQKQKGLVVDGIVGPKTWEALFG